VPGHLRKQLEPTCVSPDACTDRIGGPADGDRLGKWPGHVPDPIPVWTHFMPRFTASLAAALFTLLCTVSIANASVRWTGTRLDDGTMRFQIQDITTGLTESVELHPDDLRLDRPIMVALDVDTSSGRQGLSLVWTNAQGIAKADRIDLMNVVGDAFSVTTSRFRVDVEHVQAARMQESMTDAIARFEIDVTGHLGEMFDVLETDREQVDPVLGLAGDVDADGRVIVNDLLAVVTAWNVGCLDDEDCLGDADQDGTIGVGDILLVLQHLGETQAQDTATQSRLIHFQLVGGSWTGDDNRIHPNIYNDTEGWQALIDNNLGDISEQSPTGWDLWLHNPAGYWYDHDYTWRAPEGQSQPMVFEQLTFARQDRPGLLELDPVRQWMAGRGGNMYGYVGLPRTYASESGDWTQVPEHGAPEFVDKFYGDLLQQGFKGIGHDASAHHPADSAWVNGMLPELRSRGVEVFLESIPKRDKPHLLGQSVVAEHRLWQAFSEGHPELFFSEDDIEAAGGRAIHLVMWPLGMSPSDAGYDPDFDVKQWQYDTALALLEEGRTIALSMAGLARAGFDISALVSAAQ
jgi:hypothetical protein